MYNPHPSPHPTTDTPPPQNPQGLCFTGGEFCYTFIAVHEVHYHIIAAFGDNRHQIYYLLSDTQEMQGFKNQALAAREAQEQEGSSAFSCSQFVFSFIHCMCLYVCIWCSIHEFGGTVAAGKNLGHTPWKQSIPHYFSSV
jgi:hypothetical protein